MSQVIQEIARTYEFLADSYLATLALGLVLAYLGVFLVLKRIVFLGITLAQAASAGIAASFFAQGLLGHESQLAEVVEHHGPTASAFAASTGAVAGFALPRESRRISREALLGFGYAFFTAATVILVWKSPKGIDELKNLTAGDVLFARSHLTPLLAGLALVVAVHAALRKEFLVTSFDPEFARTLGLPVRRYEVLLALTLAVAISLSIKAAGILLVFAFLAVPPLGGLALGRTLREATWTALAIAAASSGLGFLVAWRVDLPVAPPIACLLVGLAALAAVAGKLGNAGRRGYEVLLGAMTLFALAAALDAVAAHEGIFRASAPRATDVGPVASEATGEQLLARFRSAADPAVRLEAARGILERGSDRDLEAFLHAALGDDEESVREVALEAASRFGDRGRAVQAIERLLRADDANLVLHAALGLVRLEDARGVQALIALLEDPHASAGTRAEAHDALLGLHAAGKAFGYDPFAEGEANHRAAVRWQDWWRAQGRRLPR